jgi:hypothetical protein
MAGRESHIQELRTQLQTSRWQLHDTIHHLEDRLNVPQRIKTTVAAHPIKWAAAALGVGVIAAVAVPWLVRGRGRAWMRRLISPALRIAILATLPALTRAKAKELSGPK